MVKKKSNKSALSLIKQVKKNWIIGLIVSIVILIIIVFLTIDARTFIAISKMHVEYLFLAILLTLASYVFSGIAFNILATTLGKRLSVWEGIELFTGSNFINLTTPFFNFANLPVKIYFLTNFNNIDYSEATAIVTTHAVLSIWFFIVAPLAIFFMNAPLLSAPIENVFLAALLAIFTITFFFILFIAKPSIFKRILEVFVNNKYIKSFFGTKKVRKFSKRLMSQVELTEKSLKHMFVKAPLQLFVAFLTQVFSWITIIGTIVVILIGLNWYKNLAQIFFRVLVLNFIVSLSPTPGGSGVAEIGIVAVLVDVIPRYLLAPVVLIWRFATYYLPYAFSAVFFIFLVNMRRKKGGGN